MQNDDEMWEIVKLHMGYSDEEMRSLKNNPKMEGIISKLPVLLNTAFVFEVVQSHGCGARHCLGDKLYFDGLGCLVSKSGHDFKNPERICAFAVSSMAQLIWTAQELVYAGINPNNMRLNRVCCIDVGVKCGGLGNVVFEFSSEPFTSSDRAKKHKGHDE